MGHETFADGIGRIAIIDGIVRLDLISYSPTEHGPDGKPRQVFTHRVVMGMDQFLHAADKIAKTADMIRQANRQQPVSPPQPAAQASKPQQPAPAPAAPPQQAVPRPASPTPPPVAPQFRKESVRPDAPRTPPPPQRPFP